MLVSIECVYKKSISVTWYIFFLFFQGRWVVEMKKGVVDIAWHLGTHSSLLTSANREMITLRGQWRAAEPGANLPGGFVVVHQCLEVNTSACCVA